MCRVRIVSTIFEFYVIELQQKILLFEVQCLFDDVPCFTFCNSLYENKPYLFFFFSKWQL